jgi:hypothetical protein
LEIKIYEQIKHPLLKNPMVMEIIGLEAYDNGCGELKKKITFWMDIFQNYSSVSYTFF